MMALLILKLIFLMSVLLVYIVGSVLLYIEIYKYIDTKFGKKICTYLLICTIARLVFRFCI